MLLSLSPRVSPRDAQLCLLSSHRSFYYYQSSLPFALGVLFSCRCSQTARHCFVASSYVIGWGGGDWWGGVPFLSRLLPESAAVCKGRRREADKVSVCCQTSFFYRYSCTPPPLYSPPLFLQPSCPSFSSTAILFHHYRLLRVPVSVAAMHSQCRRLLDGYQDVYCRCGFVFASKCFTVAGAGDQVAPRRGWGGWMRDL